MEKKISTALSDSKSTNFQQPKIKNIKNNILNINNEQLNKNQLEKCEPKFNLFNLLKSIGEKRTSISKRNPIDELIESISNDLYLLQNKDFKDDMFLANYLIENTKDNIIDGKNIKLIEIIFHILKKNRKNENEVFILKLFFLKMEKLISLILPQKINLNDMLLKLVCQVKCEKRNKDIILFKAGDIGEKLYILLKGIVGILIKKEKTIECTPLEFIKYLILLHLYQEESLLIEIVMKNKNIINIEERGITCLLHIFKFYYFLKETKRLNKEYNSIYDFIQIEQKLCTYLNNKFNYSPILSFDILSYEKTTIEQLYLFYSRKIKEINKKLRFGLTGSALIANFIKRQIKNSLANRPQTKEELLNYLKPYDEGKKKFKNEEEYYQKISYINEISINKILSSSEEKYIQRLDSDTLLKSIKEDTKNFVEDCDLIYEQNMKFKVLIYYEINQLYEGSIFGELALSDPNNKRSATIVTKEDCYFGTLIKQVYDLSLKAAQDKLRLRNVLFFTRGPIFKGISNNVFINKYFYTFKKLSYKNGDILFRKGEKRKSIIFIEKGELELSRNMTLYEITKIINSLGGILDDNYLYFLLNNYYEFNKYYYNHRHNIKFYVLNDKEIIGFEDLTIDDIYIFNCKCISTEKTELYEIDCNTINEAKKYNQIKNNIIDYVNVKRSIFILRLLKQRNALLSNELNKIKNSQLKTNKLSEENSSNKKSKNIFLPISKNDKFPIFLSNNKKSKTGEDAFILTTKNSKSFKTSKNFNALSTRNTDYDKNISNPKNINIKSFSLSRKNNKNSSKLLSIIKSYKIKDDRLKIQKPKYFKIKKSFFNKNIEINDEDINSTQITHYNTKYSTNNNLTYFNKKYKPYKKIYNFRTRTKLIPFFSFSKSNRAKGEVIPLILKEYHKKFPELRNDTNTNNFYFENQNIFDTLLNNEKYIPKEEKIKKKLNKDFINGKQVIYSYNTKEKEINKEKNDNNDSLDINKNTNNKANQTDINFIKPKKEYKYEVAGIIDFLCLDNWEEKEQFQKKFFSE